MATSGSNPLSHKKPNKPLGNLKASQHSSTKQRVTHSGYI